MQKLKATTLLFTALALFGCGDSNKITGSSKVDGTSIASMSSSLSGIKLALPYEKRDVLVKDLKAITLQYEDKGEQAKVLNGKDADDIHELGEKSRKYLTDLTRQNQVDRFQEVIDQMTSKIVAMENTVGKEQALKSGSYEGWVKKIDLMQVKIDEVKALTDEQIVAKYGCAGGC